MDRNKFNAEVRPYVTKVPLGKQALAFDRLELDAWVDDYIQRNGRPGRAEGISIWDVKRRQASSNVKESGTSTSKCEDDEFEKAVALVASGKRRPI